MAAVLRAAKRPVEVAARLPAIFRVVRRAIHAHRASRALRRVRDREIPRGFASRARDSDVACCTRRARRAYRQLNVPLGR